MNECMQKLRIIVVFLLIHVGYGGSEDVDRSAYNLTVGPKKLNNETGRFLYKSVLTGENIHCQFCPEKALTDSTYAHFQQKLCIENYNGKDIESQVTKKEKDSKQYALCSSGGGDIPGCGPPPNITMTDEMHWWCDPGYSYLSKSSVYFSCAVICTRTKDVVISYYCNEQLEWELDRQGTKCTAPIIDPKPVEYTENGNTNLIVGLSVGGGVLVIIMVILGFCVRRIKRKQRASNPGQNGIEDPPQIPALRKDTGHRLKNTNQTTPQQRYQPADISASRTRPDLADGSAEPLLPGGPNTSSIDTQTGNSDESIISETSGLSVGHTQRPKVHKASTSLPAFKNSPGGQMGNSTKSLPVQRSRGVDATCDTQDISGATRGAEGGATVTVPVFVNTPSSNSPPKVEVGIRIVCWKSKGKNNSKVSLPLQKGCYVIEKGYNYNILPNVSGGLTVHEFKILKKEPPGIFRGKKEPGTFWYEVYNASEEDAGLYTWTIQLENKTKFEDSFDISIGYPESSEREPPVGQERNPEVPVLNSVVHLTPESLLSSNPHHRLLLPGNNGTNLVRAEIHHAPQNVGASTILRDAPNLSTNLYSHNQSRQGDIRNDSGLSSAQVSRSSNSENRNSRLRNEIYSLDAIHAGNSRDLNRVHSEDLRCSTSGYRTQSSRGVAMDIFEARNNGVPTLDPNSFDRESVRLVLDSVADSYPLQHQHIHEIEIDDLPESERPDPTGQCDYVPIIEPVPEDDGHEQTERKQYAYNALALNNLLENERLDNDDDDDDDERLNSVHISRPLEPGDYDYRNPEVNHDALPHRGRLDVIQEVSAPAEESNYGSAIGLETREQNAQRLQEIQLNEMPSERHVLPHRELDSGECDIIEPLSPQNNIGRNEKSERECEMEESIL